MHIKVIGLAHFTVSGLLSQLQGLKIKRLTNFEPLVHYRLREINVCIISKNSPWCTKVVFENKPMTCCVPKITFQNAFYVISKMTSKSLLTGVTRNYFTLATNAFSMFKECIQLLFYSMLRTFIILLVKVNKKDACLRFLLLQSL